MKGKSPKRDDSNDATTYIHISSGEMSHPNRIPNKLAKKQIQWIISALMLFLSTVSIPSSFALPWTTNWFSKRVIARLFNFFIPSFSSRSYSFRLMANIFPSTFILFLNMDVMEPMKSLMSMWYKNIKEVTNNAKYGCLPSNMIDKERKAAKAIFTIMVIMIQTSSVLFFMHVIVLHRDLNIEKTRHFGLVLMTAAYFGFFSPQFSQNASLLVVLHFGQIQKLSSSRLHPHFGQNLPAFSALPHFGHVQVEFVCFLSLSAVALWDAQTQFSCSLSSSLFSKWICDTVHFFILIANQSK